jgi:hypothetical protein
MGNDLLTITIEKLDKEKETKLTDIDNIVHIQGRGLDEYYKILGNRKDLSDEWLEKTIESFYGYHHLNVPEKIEITYQKRQR